MNLQQLEYIVALGEHQNFGKAAESCKVTQPTLSTMIQKLEEELKVKIFDRSRQPIKATDIGVKVIEQAREVLKASNLIQSIIEEEQVSESGQITIGVLPTIAPYLIPRVLPILAKEIPNLRINFVELMTSGCLLELERLNIDIAILGTIETKENLQVTPLYYEEFFGYVSEKEELFESKTLRTAEVNAAHLWLLDEGHCFRNQLEKFCSLHHSIERQHNYRKGSLETFMNLVEQGQGITFIPELCKLMLKNEQEKFVRPFAIPRPTRQISLVTLDSFVRNHLRNRLVEIIRSVVPQHMLSLQIEQHIV